MQSIGFAVMFFQMTTVICIAAGEGFVEHAFHNPCNRAHEPGVGCSIGHQLYTKLQLRGCRQAQAMHK